MILDIYDIYRVSQKKVGLAKAAVFPSLLIEYPLKYGDLYLLKSEVNTVVSSTEPFITYKSLTCKFRIYFHKQYN